MPESAQSPTIAQRPHPLVLTARTTITIAVAAILGAALDANVAIDGITLAAVVAIQVTDDFYPPFALEIYTITVKNMQF